MAGNTSNLPGAIADAQNLTLEMASAINPLRFELVELYVDVNNAGRSSFAFPTNDNLQGKRVVYIDAYNVETMTVSPQGHTVISVATFLKSSLTLYSIKQQRLNIEELPLVALNPYSVPGGTTPFAHLRILLNNAQTDWNKSQVVLGSPLGGGGDVSFIFGVYYFDV